eukprot:CAMPEP_0201561428 /NCGR_PEP_ID=MMETSP0173_2-20130828/78791_1 /ASSEMBLY_ACC=CAM_ASM_000268 /TAXON_ID=218659 /ORGANISM="Vexillifera sp., Strain DIVA3 564/2" /LENGTH=388 /DNA_ID=CAMNT_0047975929 /DNA_START=1 /DNA_END=1165 /DNA_ORIENTATION=-
MVQKLLSSIKVSKLPPHAVTFIFDQIEKWGLDTMLSSITKALTHCQSWEGCSIAAEIATTTNNPAPLIEYLKAMEGKSKLIDSSIASNLLDLLKKWGLDVLLSPIQNVINQCGSWHGLPIAVEITNIQNSPSVFVEYLNETTIKNPVYNEMLNKYLIEQISKWGVESILPAIHKLMKSNNCWKQVFSQVVKDHDELKESLLTLRKQHVLTESSQVLISFIKYCRKIAPEFDVNDCIPPLISSNMFKMFSFKDQMFGGRKFTQSIINLLACEIFQKILEEMKKNCQASIIDVDTLGNRQPTASLPRSKVIEAFLHGPNKSLKWPLDSEPSLPNARNFAKQYFGRGAPVPPVGRTGGSFAKASAYGRGKDAGVQIEKQVDQYKEYIREEN